MRASIAQRLLVLFWHRVERLQQQPRSSRSGRIDGRSWSDKLNDNQKRWIERYLHLPFKLVQVHRIDSMSAAHDHRRRGAGWWGRMVGRYRMNYRGRRQSRAAAYEARVPPGVESRAIHGPVREEFQAPKISARPSAEDAPSKRTRWPLVSFCGSGH